MAVSRRLLNEMYGRALACVDAEFADLPAGSGGKEGADGLRIAFAEIEEQSTAQASEGGTAKAGTGQRALARRNLKAWRTSLGHTANIAARKIAGFNSNFPLPYGENDDELIINSRAVAAKAADNKTEFTKRGLNNDYVISGETLVAAFETALGVTNTALSHKGAATGGKASAYCEADEHFDELDIYIRNQYADQPDKINAWNVATRIERSAAKKDGENEGNGGENPPPPTT